MSGGRPSDEGDRSTLEEAMADVTPLEDRDKVRPAPKTVRRRRRRDTEGDAGFEIERTGEHVEGIAPGIDRAHLRKLRNGDVRPDSRIDLHGMTSAEARRRVHEALVALHGKGGRCMLVVHGRGRHSEAEPVLKEALLDWLAEPPVASLVMAFTSATGGDGGVGATYVLLRRDR